MTEEQRTQILALAEELGCDTRIKSMERRHVYADETAARLIQALGEVLGGTVGAAVTLAGEHFANFERWYA